MQATNQVLVREAADHSRDVLRLLRVPALGAWAIYLIAQPFYIFKSGLPQPGDALILLLAPLVLIGWNGRVARPAMKVMRPLLWFTLWVCVVDWGWTVVLGRWGVFGMMENMLLFPLYYIYNTLIFLLALILHQRFGDAFLRLTLYVVFWIVMFLVASSFVMRGNEFRGTLYFANPNQLGYYALLSACIIALMQRRVGLGTLRTAMGLSGCAYLATISASRSAVGGIALLVVFLVFSNPRVIIVGSLAAISLVLIGGPILEGISASHQRVLEHRQPHLSFFEQRGYDRIGAHKEHLLLGAGEGYTNRFKETTAIGASEIHSSAGTLVFCYGFVGVLLFGMFIWRMLKGAELRAMMMLLPPLAYTFAHQGLRFTLLWVLLPLFVILKSSPAVRAALRRPPWTGAASLPVPSPDPS